MHPGALRALEFDRIVEQAAPTSPSACWGTLTLTKSTVKKNSATVDGGGIFNEPGGTVTLKDSKVKNNTPNDCVGC